jgi:hypothetical protein
LKLDALRLDGNAAAGLLEEVLGSDLTVASGTCASCGAVAPVGAVHVYVAAGIVLRCPRCEAVLLRVVRGPDRAWLNLTGLRTLELPL